MSLNELFRLLELFTLLLLFDPEFWVNPLLLLVDEEAVTGMLLVDTLLLLLPFDLPLSKSFMWVEFLVEAGAEWVTALLLLLLLMLQLPLPFDFREYFLLFFLFDLFGLVVVGVGPGTDAVATMDESEADSDLMLLAWVCFLVEEALSLSPA